MLDDVVPLLAFLSCGVAAVSLAPRNGAARVLLGASVAGALAYVLSFPAGSHTTPSAVTSLARYGVFATFVLFSAGLSALLVVYPDGRVEQRWHRVVLLTVVALAVAGPLLSLVGSPSLSDNGDTGTDVRNVLALPGLLPLGRLGDGVQTLEPLFLFAGLAVLLDRYRRADAERRRELVPLLGGLLALVVLLLPVLVEIAGGPTPPQPAFEIVFQAGLALLPVVLLAGISRQTRRLAADLAASRGRLVTAEDGVRRRIERDLHDGVQQQLVALLSLTELASRQARAGSAALPATLDDVRGQLRSAIDDLRLLVEGIRPPVLEDSGVAAALESRLRSLPDHVRLDLAGARDRRWPAQTEAAAYFVACEAVTNALKHAPGAAVAVRLTGTDGRLVVEVEDDGPGLRGRGPAAGGTGLVGLRDRVDSTGGTFEVGAGPSGGTLVRAAFR